MTAMGRPFTFGGGTRHIFDMLLFLTSLHIDGQSAIGATGLSVRRTCPRVRAH